VAGEADEVARLSYQAYKAGRGTFTEVQAANLRALEARTSLARLKAQMLGELALIDSLSAE
jgi:outer membrane protein TolC